jgi:hypothetical protein
MIENTFDGENQTLLLKTSKSPIGTAHIVAADFNPPKMSQKNCFSALGTTHITFTCTVPMGLTKKLGLFTAD